MNHLVEIDISSDDLIAHFREYAECDSPKVGYHTYHSEGHSLSPPVEDYFVTPHQTCNQDCLFSIYFRCN